VTLAWSAIDVLEFGLGLKGGNTSGNSKGRILNKNES